MNKSERNIVLPVTIVGAIEFYEIYLYAYWTPILTSTFYTFTFHFIEFFTSGIMLVLVALSRPLGGLYFGCIGDRDGRKKALILSVISISALSFFMAFMPFSSSWGLFFLVFLGITKFIQGFSVGGEMPAVFCLLAEAADKRRRRFLCSFALIGPQIGQILSLVQNTLFVNYFSYEFLITKGWRISFLTASLLAGILLLFRGKLYESGTGHQSTLPTSVHNSIVTLFREHKKTTFLAFCISSLEVGGFFILAFLLTKNFDEIIYIPSRYSFFIPVLFVIPIVIIQILIGRLGESCSDKILFKISALIVGGAATLSFFSISARINILSLVLIIALLVGMCVQFALIPSLLADLFPRAVRFTGIGLSFNLCNSIVGGLAVHFSEWLIKISGNVAFFMLVYPFLSLIFLITLRFIPQRVFLDRK